MNTQLHSDAIMHRRAYDDAVGDAIPVNTQILVEERAKRNSAAENCLLHRYDAKKYPLSDEALDLYGLPLMGVVRQILRDQGLPTNGSLMEQASVALNLEPRGGMHTTSDFPLILANVANKTLRDAYDESPRSFRPIVRVTTVPNYKEVSRTQLGEAPQLLFINEDDEYERGTMGEASETYKLKKYGRIFTITRETLINDDLDAFSRSATAMGRQAANLESDLVWAVLTSNPTMGDGVVLFHATHGNVGTGVIAIAGLNLARSTMRKQTGLDGATKLGIVPRHVLVPAALETTAQQQLALGVIPTTAEEASPFRRTIDVIAEPRLDDDSALQWYLAADPGQIDTIEMAYLPGEQGPVTESRQGFEVDGIDIKIRHDVVAKALDWRGLYRSSGV